MVVGEVVVREESRVIDLNTVTEIVVDDRVRQREGVSSHRVDVDTSTSVACPFGVVAGDRGIDDVEGSRSVHFDTVSRVVDELVAVGQRPNVQAVDAADFQASTTGPVQASVIREGVVDPRADVARHDGRITWRDQHRDNLHTIGAVAVEGVTRQERVDLGISLSEEAQTAAVVRQDLVVDERVRVGVREELGGDVDPVRKVPLERAVLDHHVGDVRGAVASDVHPVTGVGQGLDIVDDSRVHDGAVGRQNVQAVAGIVSSEDRVSVGWIADDRIRQRGKVRQVNRQAFTTVERISPIDRAADRDVRHVQTACRIVSQVECNPRVAVPIQDVRGSGATDGQIDL